MKTFIAAAALVFFALTTTSCGSSTGGNVNSYCAKDQHGVRIYVDANNNATPIADPSCP